MAARRRRAVLLFFGLCCLGLSARLLLGAQGERAVAAAAAQRRRSAADHVVSGTAPAAAESGLVKADSVVEVQIENVTRLSKAASFVPPNTNGAVMIGGQLRNMHSTRTHTRGRRRRRHQSVALWRAIRV
jgi:hypothetical protein